MHRYDICIDIPAGSRVDEDTLREVLPEWIEAKDEAEAEAMIAAALSRWAENRHARILEHVTVWPSRVHVRERAYRSGYGHPPTPRVRILARRRVHGVPTGPWLHASDEDVLARATLRGLSPDECRDYLEMRACVPPGTVPLAWSPSAQAPVCVGPRVGEWTLAGRDIPPGEVAEVWRAICRDHGITSDEIASGLGVCARTVGLWRAGRLPVPAARELLDWLASRAPVD